MCAVAREDICRNLLKKALALMMDLKRHPGLKQKAILFVGYFPALYIDEVRITLAAGRTHTHKHTLNMGPSKTIPAEVISKVNK